LWYFILFGKEFLGICFDKERNKMAEKNKIIKQAIIFMSFVLILRLKNELKLPLILFF
jgi:hypothetical protein